MFLSGGKREGEGGVEMKGISIGKWMRRKGMDERLEVEIVRNMDPPITEMNQYGNQTMFVAAVGFSIWCN